MDRRAFISTLAAGVITTGSGCVSNGRVVTDEQETRMVPAGQGEVIEISEVDGKGAITYSVQAGKRFDVYYFTSPDQYEDYSRYMSGQQVSQPSAGHPELTQAAVHDDQQEEYVIEVPKEGGRKSITVDSAHYLVIDHSNYGRGVPVEKHADPLQVSYSLTVIDKQLPI